MKYSIFLPEAVGEFKNKMTRLIDLSLNRSALSSSKPIPLWTSDFFNLSHSAYWLKLNEVEQRLLLEENSAELLKEAICIEHAGIAYAQKMGLTAKTQEERHYYTAIALEEMQHLLLLKDFYHVDPSRHATGFPRLISSIIQDENRQEALVLIQIILEGWGISYYADLLRGCENQDIKIVFERILKDESRHHAGGIILYQNSPITEDASLLKSIQILVDFVRIGPQQVTVSLCRALNIFEWHEIAQVLNSINALQTTNEKLIGLNKIISKVLTLEQTQRINFNPFSLEKMAEVSHDFLNKSKIPVATKDIDL